MCTRILLSVIGLTLTAQMAEATVINFWSGNGEPPIVGAPDSLIRFMPWENAAIPNDPTSQDFADVRTIDPTTSYAATIAAADTNGWGPLAEVPDALPVFNFLASQEPNWGASALFGIPIDLRDTGPINQLTLDFTYIVDNYLGYDDGGTVVEGLFFGNAGNEVALENTANYTPYDPGDPVDTRFLSGSHSIDVTDAYNGEDIYWLYMNVTDRDVAAAGILFTGRMTLSNSGDPPKVPEPASLLAWPVFGLFAFGIGCWRKRRI